MHTNFKPACDRNRVNVLKCNVCRRLFLVVPFLLYMIIENIIQLVSSHSHYVYIISDTDPDPSSETSERVGDSGYLSPPEKKNHTLLRSPYSVTWTSEPLIEEGTSR